MKIFEEEGNKKVVYVQKYDLLQLAPCKSSIPSSIKEYFIKNSDTVIDNNAMYSFIRFDDLETIEFFKGIDWIIDFDTYSEMDIDELRGLVVEINNDICSKYNDISSDHHKDFLYRNICLDYMSSSINRLINIKNRKVLISLPVEREIKYSKKRSLFRRIRSKNN